MNVKLLLSLCFLTVIAGYVLQEMPEVDLDKVLHKDPEMGAVLRGILQSVNKLQLRIDELATSNTELKTSNMQLKTDVTHLSSSNMQNIEKMKECNSNLAALRRYEQLQMELQKWKNKLAGRLQGRLSGEIREIQESTSTVITRRIMKIENYWEEKRKDSNLWDDPFLHGRGELAYKMRLYVWPGGNGVDDHISVYLQLMPGQYDDLLKWPIPGKYEVRLLPQDRSKEPLTTWASFTSIDSHQKPGSVAAYDSNWSPDNAPLGFKKCFSHSAAESADYLRDNSIYIEVVVTSDLEDFSI